MRVFRIERKKYLNETLSGKGSALSNASRWNSKNTFIVYTAETRALSLLEISVHLDLKSELPKDRFIVEIDIPDNIKIQILNLKDLPESWNTKPPALESQFIGDDFIRNADAAVLQVPSAIIPEEYNYLINPNHQDSSSIKVVKTTKLRFDERLLQ